MRYSEIWPRYAKYCDTMVINPDRVPEFTKEAQFAVAHKAVYLEAQNVTGGFPWAMIAVIHRRESPSDKDGNPRFDTYLGNGQSLAHKTTIVPENRGPFTGPNAFLDGCADAIKVEGWGSISDWRLEKQLYYMLLFNGIGSEAWGQPSSYIWGGTNIQKPGKWIRDHVWSSTFMDPQPGCAPLLYTISKLDPTIPFVRES